MRVTWSRILAVRRADPYRFSLGDEAVAEFAPGLLQFLELRDGEGRAVGEGFAPDWVIPIGAAGTAAYAAVYPGGREDLDWWTGVSNELRLLRPCRPDETLHAVSWVEKLGRTSVRLAYRVHSRERGDLLTEGAFVFVAAGPEGPRSYTPFLFPAEKSAGEAPPPVRPMPVTPVRSFRGRAVDALLPRGIARALRLTYWHALSRRDRPGEGPLGFLAGLAGVLKSDEGRVPGGATTSRGRFLEAALPPFVADGLRRAAWDRRGSRPAPGTPAIRWKEAARTLALGETAELAVEAYNATSRPLDARVEVSVPLGFGLELAGAAAASLRLQPGRSAQLTVAVTARRPHEVNLGRPWPLSASLFAGDRAIASATLPVSVPDPDPGVLYYVLTEDCETFDGGAKTGNYGELRALGNHNDVMDPEDYRVQMIEKPDALNAIAERHGARFTHYWTAPQRFACDWAARQSKTGAWEKLASDLDESVRRGSRRHEYAPHVHFDYETESKLPPQPRLLYDAATDGILPNDYYDPVTNANHKWHGWDGAAKGVAYVKREGDLDDVDSKRGSLRKSVRHLAALTVGGLPALTVRTGAADFGVEADDLAVSARAAAANGLLANSDAGLLAPEIPFPRGRQMYFCRADALEREIDDLRDAALVELHLPDRWIETGTVEELNAWFDGRARESAGAGVRAVIAMTHAMFLRGSPDPFRSTRGGDFEKLDQHLEHVRRAHRDVRFATATEATLEFLDYYTPVPRAVALPARARASDGRTWIHPIRILGKGIPIAPERPHRVSVQAPPLFDPDEIRAMEVRRRGIPVADAARRPDSNAELPAIAFDAIGREGYELVVETSRPREETLGDSPALPSRPEAPRPAFEEAGEAEFPDLFRLEKPSLRAGRLEPLAAARAGETWEWEYPGDLFEILTNPIAGSAHPLGRRLHPYGRIVEGIAVDLALRTFPGEVRPSRVEIHWKKPIRGRGSFKVAAVLERAAPDAALAATLYESGIEVATMRVGFERTAG